LTNHHIAPPCNALKRFTPNHMPNACAFRITAAAGTKLAGASFLSLIIIPS